MVARRWLYCFLFALMLSGLPDLASKVQAHAVLEDSEPAANALLSVSPAEIRLRFSEPLEPAYSGIDLRDSSGALVTTPASQLDSADNHVLVMQLGTLPEGLYTVSWRNVSSADGHQTTGTFPFIIGTSNMGIGEPAAAPTTPATIQVSPLNVLSRWVNFVGLAISLGSIGFIVLVWQPMMHGLIRKVPQRLWRVVWVGWWLAGIGAVLLLLNQTSILLNQPFSSAVTLGSLGNVVSTTHFGDLWQRRVVLWLITGGLLLVAKRAPLMAWLTLGSALLMLLPTSQFSHAASSDDPSLSLVSDWIHLSLNALWVGGLVQFFVAIPLVRQFVQPTAAPLSKLVAYFSNYARLSVAGLIITGIYATWLQVGTWEGLTTTLYGQLLSIKLLLALLLLAIAAVNLIWTQRRLLAGQEVWVGRLRSLVGLEVVLAISILLAVGAMTAVSPARNEVTQRVTAAAIPATSEPQPIRETQSVDDLLINLIIEPGWVGNNTFHINLSDENGEPITDATLLRLRFEYQDEDLGESELQIREGGEGGEYMVSGANLSAPGTWQVRMTVQRPDTYDSVVDFAPIVDLPPPPVPLPLAIETDASLPYLLPILVITGALGMVIGGYTLGKQRWRVWEGPALLASLLVIFGLIFLLTALSTLYT